MKRRVMLFLPALAVAAVRGLAARVGGFVTNTAIQTGEGQLRSATIEVKVPATRFAATRASLDRPARGPHR